MEFYGKPDTNDNRKARIESVLAMTLRSLPGLRRGSYRGIEQLAALALGRGLTGEDKPFLAAARANNQTSIAFYHKYSPPVIPPRIFAGMPLHFIRG